MEEMDLIHDEESNDLSQLNVPCGLSCDHIPFLWRGDNHLEDGGRSDVMWNTGLNFKERTYRVNIIKGLIIIRGLIHVCSINISELGQT